MGRTKIAPVLKRRVELDYSGPYLFAGDAEEHAQVLRELRAVLAAAEALPATAERRLKDGSFCWCHKIPNDPFPETHFEFCKAARRALDRLERASKGDAAPRRNRGRGR